MNPELKAMIQTLFDLIKVIEGAVAKQDFVTALLPALYKLAADIPEMVTNWSDLSAEIKSLTGQAADADLISFVISAVPGVSGNVHAQKIISASLNLALAMGENGAALISAIKG